MTYRAAVPMHTPGKIPGGITDRVALEKAINTICINSLEAYKKFAETAGKNNADLLVFPEFGLLPYKFRDLKDKTLLYPICEALPENGEDFPASEHPALSAAQEMAIKNNLYVLINMCTCRGDDLYVTDVVFDKSGKIIAQYSKSHIFFRSFFTPGPRQPVTFEALDTVFGLLICLDLFLPHPRKELRKQGVRHYPYCAAQMRFGKWIARIWSLCNNTVIAANLGRHVGIYQKGRQIESLVTENVYFGDVTV